MSPCRPARPVEPAAPRVHERVIGLVASLDWILPLVLPGILLVALALAGR